MRTLTFAFAFVVMCAVVSSGDWPGFRGDGTGQAPPGTYPQHWSPSENVAWTTDLPGFGQSSPAVHGGVVYVTAVEGPNKETNHLLALDASTGAERWRHAFASSSPAKNTPMIGRAAPTPTADRDGVYAFFESGDLVAISPNGDVRWQRSLTKEYGPFTNRHGLGSSPAQANDALFLLVDQKESGYLLAVSKETGKTLWKTDRPDRTGWSSPSVATIDGFTQVIVSGGGAVDGYDATTGERLWSHEGLTGNSVPSPTVMDDRVYLGARFGRQQGDVAPVAKSNCALRIHRQDGGFRAETVWEADKVLSHYASPLAVDGRVYYTNNVGVLFRLDAATGKPLDRVRAGRPCWATPIAAGDRIYLFGDDGTTTVFGIDDRLTQIAVNRLWDDTNTPADDSDTADIKDDAATAAGAEALSEGPTVYGAAAADGAFLVRTGTRLYCVRER